MIFNFPGKKNVSILSLGAESTGNFSVYKNYHPHPSRPFKGRDAPPSETERVGKIYFSQDFGDLLEEKNWKTFQKAVLEYLKDNKIKPNVVLSDLHPLFKTTSWGETLAKKYGAKFIQVQHHHAHIFSAIGDKIIQDTRYKIQDTIYGITMDGTGLGTDGKIWGGEVFKVTSNPLALSKGEMPRLAGQRGFRIERIGHLENQIVLGGDLAIQEPARMLIGILYKVLNKKDIYNLIKKYYSKNQFELLYNQLEQNFNCLETSSAGRILDAVSILLGFCKNERKYKHQPISLLEANSSRPYTNIEPRIDILKSDLISNFQFPISNQFSINKFPKKYQVLNTTHLFGYLIKNLHRDKKRLSATAQLYIAKGLWKIIEKQKNHPLALSKGEMSEGQRGFNIFISGGLSSNKIISEYFKSKGAYGAKLVSHGDAGISFGQVVYFLLTMSKPNITASQIKSSS